MLRYKFRTGPSIWASVLTFRLHNNRTSQLPSVPSPSRVAHSLTAPAQSSPTCKSDKQNFLKFNINKIKNSQKILIKY